MPYITETEHSKIMKQLQDRENLLEACKAISGKIHQVYKDDPFGMKNYVYPLEKAIDVAERNWYAKRTSNYSNR